MGRPTAKVFVTTSWLWVDGEQRVGEDAAAVHPVEPDGDRAALAEAVDAGDAAGDVVVLHDRIAAAQTVHVIEDDRGFHLAAMHERAGAEPDGGSDDEQEEETEQLAHANSL